MVFLKDSDGVWRYYTNNQVDTSYTGFAASGSDQVYFNQWCAEYKLFRSYFIMVENWYYVQKGVRNTAYSGLSVYNGSWYYVKGGTADWSYTGLAQYNGVWYYVRQGSVDWEYTGLCQYDTIWFYIKKWCVRLELYRSLSAQRRMVLHYKGTGQLELYWKLHLQW